MSDNDHLYFDLRRSAMRPTWRAWLRHLFFFVLTFCTMTVAGSIAPFGLIAVFPDANPQTSAEIWSFIGSLPSEYVRLITGTIWYLLNDATVLRHGLSFSVSLLFILTCHEMGHYIACRLYGVDATLPYFIPTPPLIGPAGTFGAFIKILSPLPSRRATFDIGVAGPIAGFIALIPVSLIGLLTAVQVSPEEIARNSSELYFSDALITRLLATLVGVDLGLIFMNPFLTAAWVGILVTALNLTPSGQLDGGHAVYAVFGERVHYWTGRIAFVFMLILAAGGVYFYNSPGGILFAVLLGFMMRLRHPEPLDDSPLDFKRKIVAVITLLVFILCFVPFPIQIKF